MSLFKTITGVLLVAVLTACGGGGGDGGSSKASSSTGGSSTTTTTPVSSPSIALVFTDSVGVPLSSNAITSGSIFYARATLSDPNGAPINNALVNFTTDATVGLLSQNVVLTNGSGIAKVQISPATISTSSAAKLTAQAVVGNVTVNSDVSYQTSAASVSLGALTATPNAISALQSAAVTTKVKVGNTDATAGQVSVTFAANCGSFSPASAPTLSDGTASSTYQSTSNCSGAVTISANAAGATTPGTGTINVAAASAANILFVSASPLSIVSSSATGIKQSTIRFKLVDSGGNSLASQSVVFSLDAQSTAAGVTFNVGSNPTSADQAVNTDAQGIAQITIQSGGFPTPVIVKATLASTAGAPTPMFATSSGIVVTAGKASQNKSSLSADKLSIEGLNVDGVQSTLTWRVSDRQGNPVPAGSAVTFVASNGTVTGSCLLDASSSCSVTYTTSGNRPSALAGGVPGRIVILAYMDGEESFVDNLVVNNTWDASEPFTDMGVAYRDDNLNGKWDIGEQLYPGNGSIGAVDCTLNGGSNALSQSNTCDGTWSGSIRVRQTMSITLASSFASIAANGPVVTGPPIQFSVIIGDSVNTTLSMPTGTTVSVTPTAGASTVGTLSCAATVSPNVVRNSNLAGNHDVVLTGTNCGGAVVEIDVIAPSGSKTSKFFSVP